MDKNDTFSFDVMTSTLTCDEYVLHDITVALCKARVDFDLTKCYVEVEVMEYEITYQNFYKLAVIKSVNNSTIATFEGSLVYIENFIDFEKDSHNKGLRIPDDTKMFDILKIKQIKIIPSEPDFNEAMVVKWEREFNNKILPKLDEYVNYIRNLEEFFGDIDCELHDDAEYTC